LSGGVREVRNSICVCVCRLYYCTGVSYSVTTTGRDLSVGGNSNRLSGTRIDSVCLNPQSRGRERSEDGVGNVYVEGSLYGYISRIEIRQ
jgi:hypothetical protein